MKWSKMRNIDSEKLYDAMVEKGWTVTEMSKKIGSGSSYVSHALTTGRISGLYLIKICEVLHISQAEVLAEKQEPFQMELPIQEIDKITDDQEAVDSHEKRFDVMLSKIAAAMQEYVSGGHEDEYVR